MGHQQLLDYAIRFVRGRSQHGLIAGACYLHDEDYKQFVPLVDAEIAKEGKVNVTAEMKRDSMLGGFMGLFMGAFTYREARPVPPAVANPPAVKGVAKPQQVAPIDPATGVKQPAGR